MRAGIDQYATRVEGEPEIRDRMDPCVWGLPSTPELEGFAERGYLQRYGVISSATVEACLAEIERVQEDPRLEGDERIIREEHKTAVRSIFDIDLLSTVVREAISESGAEELAREILGSEVYVHQSRLNYKPGFQGGAFYWHSDFETWHAEDGMPIPRAVSASIALTRNEAYNGPLMIIPGSQRLFVQCAGKTPVNYHRRSLVTTTPQIGVPSQDVVTELWNSFGIDMLTGPVGSMTMFDSNVMHASGGNITPIPRANIFVVFNSVENRLGQPFAAGATRPPYLARRG
ncbi:phytanoyl-CoA dioxygenase family protein [Rhodococcus spongiicola]|uniref:Ectoine hydroxylase n=1 Tax=Rhodococcus spongiicola TaxID=2487352 RepID=A0A438APU4_9NOCA|nr:phytanoyl-CoA dioxygenase family protein [Rhodococcus spongiicola]RVW00958.1 ectoine hydroxylase [Rhodococcus spongiicola]